MAGVQETAGRRIGGGGLGVGHAQVLPPPPPELNSVPFGNPFPRKALYADRRLHKTPPTHREELRKPTEIRYG